MATVERDLKALKALADETRLRILEQLRQKELCGKALAARLDISEAAVSQHISILREALLVCADRKGYWTHYSINSERLKELSRKLESFGGIASLDRTCDRIRARMQQYEGKEVKTMCKPCCERPERLKGRPDECTLEQIRECHGEGKDHPCAGKHEKGKKD